MASLYAGVLGLLAFASCIVRGLLYGSDAQTTLVSGGLYLATFAVLGAILGHVAGRTVEEAVRQRVAAHVAAEQEREEQASTGVTKPAAA